MFMADALMYVRYLEHKIVNAAPSINAPVSPRRTVMLVIYAGQNMERISIVPLRHVRMMMIVMMEWFAKVENVQK